MRKKSAQSKPRAVKTVKVRPPKEVIHLDYLRVYHEVLKHEDVLDIELDQIFDATVSVVQDKLAKGKLTEQPEPESVEIMVKEVMEKLCA